MQTPFIVFYLNFKSLDIYSFLLLLDVLFTGFLSLLLYVSSSLFSLLVLSLLLFLLPQRNVLIYGGISYSFDEVCACAHVRQWKHTTEETKMKLYANLIEPTQVNIISLRLLFSNFVGSFVVIFLCFFPLGLSLFCFLSSHFFKFLFLFYCYCCCCWMIRLSFSSYWIFSHLIIIKWKNEQNHNYKIDNDEMINGID